MRLALAIACLGLGACGAEKEPTSAPNEVGGRGTMRVRRVVSEPLAEDPVFTVLEHHPADPDGRPTVCVLSPSRDTRVRGADLLSIVLPPPAAVELVVPSDPGLVLDLSAGLDHSAMAAYAERFRGCSLEFEIGIGSRIHRERLSFESVGHSPGSEWITHEGVDLEGAERLTLRTRLFDAGGKELVPEVVLPAGFGGLKIVRPQERPRTLATAERPSIVLIVMDTQRADRLSAYGYERPTSPRLEELAARGVLFERAYSTSNWTWPSTASILTGLPPEEHGLVDLQSCFLAERLDTLAEVLQDEGYTTAGWSANYLVAADKNFDQGFERYTNAQGASQPSSQVVPQVLRFLEAVGDTRFFLYVHLLDPHAPLDPLPEARAKLAADVPADFSPTAINDYRWCLLRNGGHTETGERVTERCVGPEEQQHLRELYDACTWSGDHQVGRLLDALDALGLSQTTVVAYTSDHGEEFFEHGLLTHGQSLHPELVHVPLIVAGPGLPAGKRVTTQVSNRFLAPTLARLGGTQLLGSGEVRDLFELESPQPVLYSTSCGWWNGENWVPILGVRTEERVLHWAPTGAPWGADPGPEGEIRLYDAREDPGESRDLARDEPETRERLRSYLEQEIERRRARRTTPSLQGGAATRARLSELGYTDD